MSYSNSLLSDQSYKSANKYVQGLPGVGFKLTDTGDYDMQNKKLVNVKQGTNNNDVITKSQFDVKTNLLDGVRPGTVVNDKAVIYSSSGAVHAQSLYLKDTPDNAGNSDEIRIMTEHQSHENIHLYIPDLENYDGFGNRRRSELMVTSVDQTVTGKKVFRDIEVPNPTLNNQATNKYYVDHNFFNQITGGQIGGDLILQPQPYPIQGNTNKAISYETQREIFLSRRESFPMQADINMNNNFIQNVATPTTSHQVTNKGYCDYNFLNRQKGGVIMGPLSMNRNDLIGIPDTPKYGYSAVNKNYVDGEISKITTVDTNQFVLKSGSTMTGDLNMNNHLITNVKKPTSDNDATNKNYVDLNFLNLIGYVNQTISESHINTSDKTNVFKYLNDPNQTSSERNITVNSFSDWTNSPHKYNKRAYDVTLQRHSGANSYDSKIGINLYSAGAGKFTLVFDFQNPTIMSNVNITASASTSIIHKQTQRKFNDHAKVVVQVDNSKLQTPDYLYYRIQGQALQGTINCHIIIYGVSGFVDSVDSDIYDDVYYYLNENFEDDSGNMKIKKDVNLDNHLITNLRDGVNSSDCVNKRQLDSVSYYTNNHTYRSIFDEFYDLVETSRFNINKNAFGVVILGVLPNLHLGTNQYLNNYDRVHGLQMNNGYLNLKNKVNQSTSFTIFISLYFSSDIKIQFSGDIVSQNGYYPSYSISNNRLDIIESSSFPIIRH